MEKRMKIAIVGCGDIARFTAIGFILNKGIKTVACVDKNIDRAKSFSRWFMIPRYFGDYSEMLDKVELDAVYLAVPHILHEPMIKQALEKGQHVFCEKPVTTKMDDAIEVCRLAKETGLKVGINYQYRYDKSCYAMAQAAHSGELGEILYGRCNVPWHRTEKYFSGSPWHKSLETSGGGTLLTQGSHALDILLWACGKEPLRALGMTAKKCFKDVEVEDLAMTTIELEGGIILQAASSMVAATEQKVTIDVYGRNATALYTGFSSPAVKFKGVQPIKRSPPAKGMHALFRSVEGFRAWVMEDKPYLTPAHQSLSVLAVIEAVYRSAVTGKTEEVDHRHTEYKA
jgi:UDP-N-acetyl-2-amino-2-deoxyglucuronate dehydrogenase